MWERMHSPSAEEEAAEAAAMTAIWSSQPVQVPLSREPEPEPVREIETQRPHTGRRLQSGST